jgi:hypothetical protein
MVRAASLLLGLMLACAAPAFAQAPVAAPAAAPGGTPLYVCIYRAGPAWLAGKPASAQPLRPHGAYMKRLFDEGRLLAGGPMPDTEGGMAIVRADDLEAAKAIFAVDPAITAGVMIGEVHSWTPVFLSDKPLKP